MTKFRLLAVVAIISLAAVGLSASTADSQAGDPNDPDRGIGAPGEGSSGLDDFGPDTDFGDGGGALDQQILDDLIVDGSICAGLDCVNGESFGFDTLRLKENNLRIRAFDTSTSASFPSNDWQITFNDSSNGGQNKFSIDDLDSSRTLFTIEAGAPSHSLYVDDGGRIGLGTSTPVAEVHIKDGDTPTVRLEQDGSSGFTPQTFDVAANETNFFIRDATNGSTLPFRIRPGAPTSALDIAADGDVGIGTSSPDAHLHLRNTVAEKTTLQVENTNAQNVELLLTNSVAEWTVRTNSNGDLVINTTGTNPPLFILDSSGNLTIQGTLTCSTSPNCG